MGFSSTIVPLILLQLASSSQPKDKAQKVVPEALRMLLSKQLPLTGCLDVTDEEFNRELHPGKLLMRTGCVLAASQTDPVRDLMHQLRTEDRRRAVKYYLSRNKYEVGRLTKRMKCNVSIASYIALVSQRHPDVAHIEWAMAPLIHHVSTYVRDRVGRSLYDFVPSALRDPIRYDTMFTELTPDELSVRKSDNAQITAYLSGTAVGRFNQKTVLDAEGLFQLNESTFVNLNAGGVRVNPRKVVILAASRALLAVDAGKMKFWRVDCAEPLVVDIRDGDVGLVASDTFYYLGYSEARSGSEPADGALLDFEEEFWAYSRLPGLVYKQYTGAARIASGAFKVAVSLNEPAVLGEIERVAAVGVGFDELMIPDTALLGEPVTGVRKDIHPNGPLDVALCDPEITASLCCMRYAIRGSKMDIIERFGMYGEDIVKKLLHITGKHELKRVPKLNERQSLIRDVFKLYREGRHVDASFLLQNPLLSDRDDFDLLEVFASH